MPSRSLSIASGWSPAGGKIWLRRKGLLGKVTLTGRISEPNRAFYQMNAPHTPSPLASVPMAAPDPILGVTEAFVADQNPRKVNVGVGVYLDNSGKIPLLECVRHAESERLKSVPHRGYLPIDGLGVYDKAVQELVFGSSKPNIVTVQALGGPGGQAEGAALRQRI